MTYVTTHGPVWQADGTVIFQLFAPSASSVALLLEKGSPIPMQQAGEGRYVSVPLMVKPGSHYRFLIDERIKVPDPASRYQPQDVHGPSELVQENFPWEDQAWNGRPWEETVLYELHVGCFSTGGTFLDVEAKLPYLQSLGVTAIELMPVGTFAGHHNWGYDGVLIYAPEKSYGQREDLKSLINRAHQYGIMVFLDVIYNHFGPVGNYLPFYALPFFRQSCPTPWGDAIDFTQIAVREFFIQNALYWIHDFHIDGLRFDAVHAIWDESARHFLVELAERVKASVPPTRHVHLVLENERNEARYLSRNDTENAEAFTAQWNDDVHHVLHVLLTGENNGYYADYQDNTLGRLLRCLTEGFDYQGEPSFYGEGKKRGEPSNCLPPTSFVNFLQNHDQIGNRAYGDRITMLALPAKLTLARTILCLSPFIPMMFMGEEWDTHTPFPFFCDYEGEMATAVKEGRQREFAHFLNQTTAPLPDPVALTTFISAKLQWQETELTPYKDALSLTQTLLYLRKQYVIPLLMSGWIKNTGSIEKECVRVSWHFKSGSLHMLANFSPIPYDYAPLTKPVGGIIIFESDLQENLPAWASLWWITEGETHV